MALGPFEEQGHEVVESRPTTLREKYHYLKNKYREGKSKVQAFQERRREQRASREEREIEELSRKRQLVNARTNYAIAQQRHSKVQNRTRESPFGGIGGNMQMFMPPKSQTLGTKQKNNNLDFLLGPQRKKKTKQDNYWGGGLV